ncbi:NAD(P)H-binding protein [soil metagenome]
MTTPEQSSPNRIFITGATGFVGSALVSALGDRPLRLLVRDVDKFRDLESQHIEVVEGDVTDAGSLRETMLGCSTVIHLVAIIEESGNRSFDQVIRQGTENAINEARASGVRRFIQMSALGAANLPNFPYHQSKWRAEEAVRASGLDWTIVRPSIIFGPGDGFITTLAGVVRTFPILPVVGDGTSRFQPIAVEDVAASLVSTLDTPNTIGGIYELGGPDILTYEELLQLIAKHLGKTRRAIHIPVPLMRAVVSASKPLPKKLRPPVTHDQLRMLALDNTTANSATERLIGHPPRTLRDNLGYIDR